MLHFLHLKQMYSLEIPHSVTTHQHRVGTKCVLVIIYKSSNRHKQAPCTGDRFSLHALWANDSSYLKNVSRSIKFNAVVETNSGENSVTQSKYRICCRQITTKLQNGKKNYWLSFASHLMAPSSAFGFRRNVVNPALFFN